jgi:ADP-ribosylglycohydrolase
MYGAILGDIIGSRFEFDMGDKTKDFDLFADTSMFTDDSVMTVAVAEALLNSDTMLKSRESGQRKNMLTYYI